MGVYHFMGLGRSVGAVTGPLSYLAWRFERWDNSDQEFFGVTGELAQRTQGEKVGDVQALVLFSTPEVLHGEVRCYEYVINQPGQCPKGESKLEAPIAIREALRVCLRKVWRPVAKGRQQVKLYWCEVDRTDLLSTFQRAAEVILAVKSSGGLGKEVWINLTSGNNVTNLALQLGAELTGTPARFYYVQAESLVAEKCIHYTRAQGYWVDLPLLPVRPHEASRRLVELVAANGNMETLALFTQAKQKHWDQFQDADDLDQFRRLYVRPLLFQEMLAADGETLRPGRRWPLMQPYYQTLDTIGREQKGLRELDDEPRFEEEDFHLD